jgi:hypothetical protein
MSCGGRSFSDSSENLGNGCTYVFESNLMKYITIDGYLCDKSKICEINANVIAKVKDERFIILVQNPLYKKKLWI